MIRSLSLKNFKSIKNHTFPLRNLNVAIGLNGMGKTSFIQSVLLLAQSEGAPEHELRLNGALVDIGKGSDAFYQFSQEDELYFSIAFDDREAINYSFLYDKDADYLAVKTKSDQYERVPEVFKPGKLQYIAASRTDPQVIHLKSYTNVVKNYNQGKHGQFTAHFLHVYGSNEIVFQNLVHPMSNSLLLSEQVNRWMGEISPGVKFNTSEIPNSDNILMDIQFEQPNTGFTGHFRPTNVGFGISYALPVVTALLAARPGGLVIIENPESHIHPRGQAELGKLIAKTAMNEVQVILETHSDHIINGIRVAVKEGQLSKDKAILFFFDRIITGKEQFSKITDITINDVGELSDYPRNLLDEWSNQLVKLI
jgi:predicted ATPase